MNKLKNILAVMLMLSYSILYSMEEDKNIKKKLDAENSVSKNTQEKLNLKLMEILDRADKFEEEDDEVVIDILKKIQDLIRSGVNLNIINKNGESLLIYLVSWPSFFLADKNLLCQTLRLLVEYRADLNIQDKEGKTALIKAIFGLDTIPGFEASEVFKILVDADADMNIKDNNGNTVLSEFFDYYSGTFRHFNDQISVSKDIALLLIKSGANLYIKNNQNLNVLDFNKDNLYFQSLDLNIEIDFEKDYASSDNDDECLAYDYIAYQEIFVCINKQINKTKMLYQAIERGNINGVKLYIKERLPLYIFDENGNTPLHIAAIHDQKEIFKLIVSSCPKLVATHNNDNVIPVVQNPQVINDYLIGYLEAKNELSSNLFKAISKGDVLAVKDLIAKLKEITVLNKEKLFESIVDNNGLTLLGAANKLTNITAKFSIKALIKNELETNNKRKFDELDKN